MEIPRRFCVCILTLFVIFLLSPTTVHSIIRHYKFNVSLSVMHILFNAYMHAQNDTIFVKNARPLRTQLNCLRTHIIFLFSFLNYIPTIIVCAYVVILHDIIHAWIRHTIMQYVLYSTYWPMYLNVFTPRWWWRTPQSCARRSLLSRLTANFQVPQLLHEKTTPFWSK